MIIRCKVLECSKRTSKKSGREFHLLTLEPETPINLTGFCDSEVAVGKPVLCSVKDGRVEDITIM